MLPTRLEQVVITRDTLCTVPLDVIVRHLEQLKLSIFVCNDDAHGGANRNVFIKPGKKVVS